MPRQRRRFVAGLSAHIFKRGNNRMDIFHESADYVSFLAIVSHAVSDHGVSLHAHVVMKNHFHLIATPADPLGVPRAMKEIGERYTTYYNRKYERTGTPWSGRYRAKPINDERYLLTCLRYVEQNPVRAGIVGSPDVYRWSSYAAHAFGSWPEWLTPHPVYLALGRTAQDRQFAYRTLCGAPLHDDEMAMLRCAGPLGVRPQSDPGLTP